MFYKREAGAATTCELICIWGKVSFIVVIWLSLLGYQISGWLSICLTAWLGCFCFGHCVNWILLFLFFIYVGKENIPVFIYTRVHVMKFERFLSCEKPRWSVLLQHVRDIFGDSPIELKKKTAEGPLHSCE